MGRGRLKPGVATAAGLPNKPIAPGARVLISGGLDDIPDGSYGTVQLTPGQNDSVHYIVRCQDAAGRWHSVSLHPCILTAVAGPERFWELTSR